VLLARVYVGAHNPLDVICGAALGLVIGSCINLALRVPAARSRSVP
jgi:undecaprenyl-diphosphatase